MKALYATGFFRDVRLEAQGDVLVVAVQERPTISSLTFVGNKEFDTDTIKKALKDIGIAEARIFDRSALDRAEQELKRQYITRGKYAANVQTTVTPQERNRVAINFTIDEGESAKIARINIVGAKAFTEKQLLSRDDADDAGLAHLVHEERPVLEAEAVGRPRGAAQLLPEPRLPRVQRRFDAGVDHAGQGRHLHHAQHHRGAAVHRRRRAHRRRPRRARRASSSGSIRIKPGDVFSREKLQASAKDISDRLGAEGYAFANVNAVPELDRDKRTASFTFYVDPGRRAYVRKINISGNAKTRDEVIRREFRQLEDAWYDGPRIERSKVRVKRLGYFDDVNVETPPVPGSADQVDIEVAVTEKSTGNLLAGVGYSSAEGIVLNASISQQNIFGSGNALSLGVNTSRFNRTYSMLFTEPYYTVDGVSRTIEAVRQEPRSDRSRDLAVRVDTLGAALGFGVPITETDTINFGGRFEHTNITLFDDSPPVYQRLRQPVRRRVERVHR